MKANSFNLPENYYYFMCNKAVSSACSKLTEMAVEEFKQEQLSCEVTRNQSLTEYYADLN